MDYNHEQIQARIVTARELRARALGETLARWQASIATQLVRGATALRVGLDALIRRRSHS